MAGFTVVCPDLRGYGRSTAPAPLADHAQASKRVMAADVVALLSHLGSEEFAVVGHDRGSYVAFRLAMDHPNIVTRLAVLDSVPIGEALARADVRFAQEWWHWFFFAQPELPERVILADPDAWYRTGLEREAAMGVENYADFRRAIHDPAVVAAMLEDYRAGLGVDRVHDDADRAAGRRLQCSTLVAWSTRDDMERLYGNPLDVWRPWAADCADNPSTADTTSPNRILKTWPRYSSRTSHRCVTIRCRKPVQATSDTGCRQFLKMTAGVGCSRRDRRGQAVVATPLLM